MKHSDKKKPISKVKKRCTINARQTEQVKLSEMQNTQLQYVNKSPFLAN